MSSLLGLSVLMVNVLNILWLSQSLVFGAGVNSLIFNPPGVWVPLPPSQALVVSAGLLPLHVGDGWISQRYQVTQNLTKGGRERGGQGSGVCLAFIKHQRNHKKKKLINTLLQVGFGAKLAPT